MCFYLLLIASGISNLSGSSFTEKGFSSSIDGGCKAGAAVVAEEAEGRGMEELNWSMLRVPP